MGARPYEERVAEIQRKRNKTAKRLAQYDEQLKDMEKKEKEDRRKRRNHLLIVAGADIASIYERSYLEKDEIYAVANFLREQQELGVFSLGKKESATAEDSGGTIEETQKDEDVLYGGLFDF